MSNADKAMGIAFGAFGSALLVSGIICVPIIFNGKNQKEDSLKRINAKIERDMEVDSFSTQNIIFDKTNENYVIKITGSSKESSYLAANYKVSEQDFYNIKPKESDFVKIKDLGFNHKFLANVLDVLYCSEFLGQEAEKLALTNSDEIVLNLSRPYIDEETNSINYNLTIAKLQNNDLKLGTFVVSAPLDEGLKENPKEIYSKPAEEVKIEKVDTKTYKDVLHVEMHDDYTLVV